MLLAEVHPFDAAGVADVGVAAEGLRLVDVAQGDVGVLPRQVAVVEDHVLVLGNAEERGHLGAADVDVGH